jgi:CheY-like chemotaxis protein
MRSVKADKLAGVDAYARFERRSVMHIMLVDDDPLDAETVRRVLRGLSSEHKLETVANAEEALLLLRRRLTVATHKGTAPLPDLILLDLNMPGMSGQELLAALGSDVRFKAIPVVVLTTSGLPQDVSTCFERGADGYFVKPLEYTRFADLLERIIDYWILCETPQRPSAPSP